MPTYGYVGIFILRKDIIQQKLCLLMDSIP